MARASKDQIIAEIHRLIDEQLSVLKERLTNGEAVEYHERAKRIAELLDLLRTSNHQRS